MLQGSASAEYRTFQTYLVDLLSGIQEPIPLSFRLFGAGILSTDTRKKISDVTLTQQQKVLELLNATETVIRFNPENFHKFVDELKKDSPMQHLCDKLRSTCGECDNVCL